MTEASRAVFLSYASQDAEAAGRICASLRAAGVEVWFDQSELRGGDAWDQAIHRQIRDCALFVPVISARTQARLEGYFRREWKLAVARTHDMADEKRFLVPVVIDGTSEPDAMVPEVFRTVQWTRLPGGETPPAFCERIRGLLGSEALPARPKPVSRSIRGTGTRTTSNRWMIWAASGAFLVGLMGWLAWSRLTPKHLTGTSQASTAVPEKSIAVLPFVDMSEKKDQEYFADGMAEEILNLLVKVPELKVIGRTSSFAFKGKADDLRKIGATLGAAYLVEGSVRRAGDHIRVTAELIDARDGAHRWSETYDRDVSDVLMVQREIATSLARALQLEVNASGHFGQQTLQYGEAYESYLRGLHAWNRFDQSGYEEATVDFRHALDVDPAFAPAADELARTLLMQTLWGYVSPRKGHEQARAAAEAALRLNPKSALAHAVLGGIHTTYDYDWPAAERELNEALALAPANPHVLVFAADECLAVGRWNEAVRFTDSAIAADPLHANIYEDSGEAYLRLGRLAEAEHSARRVLEISPTYAWGHYNLAVILLAEGKLEAALAEAQTESAPDGRLIGLVFVYQAMHRSRDADAAFARFKADYANDQPMLIAKVYAVRGERDQAFEWLDRAFSSRDPDLWLFKGHVLLKNLEGDPRYKAFLRKMNLSP